MAFDLSDLEFSVETYDLLRGHDITTLERFLGLTKEDILTWKGAGIRTFHEIADTQDRLRSRRPSRIDQVCDLVTELNRLLPLHQIALQLTADGKLAVYERKA